MIFFRRTVRALIRPLLPDVEGGALVSYRD